ncbi:uncharacterized protein [Acropora muricata]|uniref:uncharacterized protein n=1 Tax=Acropora muricata TaxID=159855 RepID=UPI0034E39B65
MKARANFTRHIPQGLNSQQLLISSFRHTRPLKISQLGQDMIPGLSNYMKSSEMNASILCMIQMVMFRTIKLCVKRLQWQWQYCHECKSVRSKVVSIEDKYQFDQSLN